MTVTPRCAEIVSRAAHHLRAPFLPYRDRRGSVAGRFCLTLRLASLVCGLVCGTGLWSAADLLAIRSAIIPDTRSSWSLVSCLGTVNRQLHAPLRAVHTGDPQQVLSAILTGAILSTRRRQRWTGGNERVICRPSTGQGTRNLPPSTGNMLITHARRMRRHSVQAAGSSGLNRRAIGGIKGLESEARLLIPMR